MAAPADQTRSARDSESKPGRPWGSRLVQFGVRRGAVIETVCSPQEPGTRRPPGQSGARALRKGALEICINPVKGALNSRARKSAPDAETAQTIRAAIRIGLGRENIPKLSKIMVSQKMRTTRNGSGTEPPDCSNSRTCLCQIGSKLYRPILDDTLSLVLGRKLQNYCGGVLARPRGFEGRSVCVLRPVLSPDPLDQKTDGLPKSLASRLRFRTVLRQKLIEQDDVGADVLNVTNLRIIRTIRGGDQQAKYKGGDGSNQSSSEPDDVLRVICQMPLRQHSSEP
jgi:hypothetical protein